VPLISHLSKSHDARSHWANSNNCRKIVHKIKSNLLRP